MTGTWYWDLQLGVILAVVWLTLGFLMIVMPPAAGLAWVAAITILFAWIHVGRRVRRRRRRPLAAFRVRPLAGARRLFTLALPSVFLAGAAASWLIGTWTGPDVFESRAWDMINAYTATPAGWLAVALMVALLGPLIEEFYFRGLIQRSLERRFNFTIAVAVTATVFGLVHLHGWPWLLQPIAMGLLWGYVAFVARSVWASFVMHATWNGVGIVVSTVTPDFNPTPENASAAAAALMIAALVLGVLGLRKWARLHRSTLDSLSPPFERELPARAR